MTLMKILFFQLTLKGFRTTLSGWLRVNSVYLRANFYTIFFALTFFSVSQSYAVPRKIWIDTDIMIGPLGRDVDDGLALLMALRCENVEIMGITLSHRVDHGYKVTQKMLGWYNTGKPIPVYKGAKTQKELGQENDATRALTEALKKEKMSIAVLGPATNLATVLMLHPELESQIIEVVYCAGRRPGMLFNPGKGKIKISDYNFELDTAAFKFLIQKNIPTTLSCYEASSYIWLNKEDIKKIKANKIPGNKWLYRQLNDWRKIWRVFLGSKKGFNPFDTATIGHLLYPEHFKYDKDIPLKYIVAETDTKYTIKTDTKPFLWVSYDYDSDIKVDYCYQALPSYHDVVIKAISGN